MRLDLACNLDAYFQRVIIFLMMTGGLVGLYCCSKTTEIGAPLIGESGFEVLPVDTLSLAVYTEALDSLVTSESEQLLLGCHRDERLGAIRAVPYFQLGPEESYELDEQFTTYDSITLHLDLNGYSYYDTLRPLTFRVHALAEDLEPEDEEVLYNTAAFDYHSTPLGTYTFRPRPRQQDGIEVRLHDEFGRRLFSLAQEGAEELSGSFSFLNYFEGLVLVPDTVGNAAMLGLSRTAELRVYYRNSANLPVQEEALVFTTGNLTAYSRIQADRRGTSLAGLEETIRSTRTSNEAYVQAGTGLVLRVEIPYLRNLLEEYGELVVSSALLKMYPVEYDYQANTPLPGDLIATPVDGDNVVIGPELLSRLAEDREFKRDTYYEFNVTDFVIRQINTAEFNDNALLISLPEARFNIGADRLYIGDGAHERAMELTVFMPTLKNNE